MNAPTTDIEGIIITASWLVLVLVIFFASFLYWRIKVLKDAFTTDSAPDAEEPSPARQLPN